MKYLPAGIAMLIMGTIFYFSSIPDLHFIDSSVLPLWLKSLIGKYSITIGNQGFFSYVLSLHPDFIIHKLGHIGLYGLLGVCLFWATKGSFRWSVMITAIFAVTDELHQGYVPGRSSRFGDILLDVSAAVVFILVMRKLKKR